MSENNCWRHSTLHQSSIQKPDTGRKSRFFPHLGGSRRNVVIKFGMEKLQWCGYPMVKKIVRMFSRFDTIRERDGQTPPDGIAALCSLVAVARQKSSAQNFSSKQIILDLQFFCGLQIERRPTDLQILWIWIDMRIVLHTILQPQNHWLAVTNERARNVHKPWRTCLHVSCCCSHVVAAIRCYDRFSQCVGLATILIYSGTPAGE